MIDTSKIKAGDKVRIDGSPNWREVIKVFKMTRWISLEGGHLISESLITDHRPAEPVVPKGEGCVDLSKEFYILTTSGFIERIHKIKPCEYGYYNNEIAQGNVSNIYEHLERKRDRQRIEQELLECEGAVYEPFASVVCFGDKEYWGIFPVGIISHVEDIDSAIMEFACHFISEATARAALEKVGAERIMKAWGLDYDR